MFRKGIMRKFCCARVIYFSSIVILLICVGDLFVYFQIEICSLQNFYHTAVTVIIVQMMLHKHQLGIYT